MNNLNLVSINNNQVVVSSRQVAENFKKRHCDVLESINEILKTENSVLRFFYESTYKVQGNNKSYKEYLMNRDGFSLLVMGFTGEKALEWKVKYINAFNAMEQELRNKELEKPKQANERDKAMLLNAQSRQATLFMKLSERSSIPEFKRIMEAYGANSLAGKEIVSLPEAKEKTYSATDIGNMLGVSKNKIGVLANANGMKCDRYGKLFYDKSPYNGKEVETFRYYECAIDKFKELLDSTCKAS